MRIQRIYREPAISEENGIDLAQLGQLIEKYQGKKGIMIPLLQGTQDLYGFIPRAAFELISERTGIPLSDMFGVATFYAQFRLKPVGKNIIKVCHGTACHVQNAKEITEALEETLGIRDGETTEDRFYTLELVACLGCCSLAPVMMISNQAYGKLTGAAATKIVKNIRLAAIEN